MTGTRFEYSVYGLFLTSNRALPGLCRARGSGVPVHIDFADGPVAAIPPGLPFHTAGMERLWHLSDDAWLLHYENALGHAWSVEVRGGTELTVRWNADSLLDDIPGVLIGAGLATALHLQDVTVLHASVVAVAGAAILIVGDAGAGKSTTAAALVRSGCPLVSDDLAVLADDARGLRVHSGYPGLRVFAESARAAGWRDDAPRLFTNPALGDKRYVDLPSESFVEGALPMRAIYALQAREACADRPRVEPVAPGRALGFLLGNIYRAPCLDARRRERSLQACARMASTIPVRAVHGSDDLAKLPLLAAAIREDALPGTTSRPRRA